MGTPGGVRGYKILKIHPSSIQRYTGLSNRLSRFFHIIFQKSVHFQKIDFFTNLRNSIIFKDFKKIIFFFLISYFLERASRLHEEKKNLKPKIF